MTVRHIRLGPAQQLARIMQEQRSGQFLADVVYNNLLHLIYLKESGILGKYESPENRFLLRDIELIPGWIMGSDAGKRNVVQSFRDQHIRILSRQPFKHRCHVVHFEAKVVEPRADARLPLKQSVTDETVADMATLGIIIPRRIGHAIGDFLHAKDGFVKLRHPIVVFSADGDVFDARFHDLSFQTISKTRIPFDLEFYKPRDSGLKL